MIISTWEALEEYPKLKQENEQLRKYIERLRTELAKHGWGDFHYGTQPQDPAIVALLEEKY